MCPVCLASISLTVAGAVSAGGLAALAAKVSFNNKTVKEIVSKMNERINQNVNHHRDSENRLAQ